MEGLPDTSRTPEGEPLQGEVQRASEWQQDTRAGADARGSAEPGIRAVVLTTPLPRWLAVLLTLLLTVCAVVIGYLAGALALVLLLGALLFRFVRRLMAGR